MTETTAPKKRGRKPTGQAMTSAERQRAYRERQRQRLAEIQAQGDCRQCAELRAELEATRAMLERHKALLSEQDRQLIDFDNQLRLHKRASKIEANRLKRELDEARKIIDAGKREAGKVPRRSNKP